MFENLDKEEKKSISISPKDDSYFDESYSPSSFTLGTQDDNSKETVRFVLKTKDNIDSVTSNTIKMSELKIRLNKELEGVDVYIEKSGTKYAFTNPTEEVNSDVMYTLKDMKEGQCTLYTQILPDTTTKFTSLEEFQNYNPYDSDNIETNVNENNIKEYKFKILKTDDRGKIESDLVYPVDNTAFCLDESDKLQGTYDDLVLLIQSSDGNIKDKELKYNIRVTSDSVTGNLLKEEVKNQELNTVNGLKRIDNLLDEFDTDKIKDGLNNQFKKIEAELKVEIFDKDRSDYSETHTKELIITECYEDAIFGEDDEEKGNELKEESVELE